MILIRPSRLPLLLLPLGGCTNPPPLAGANFLPNGGTLQIFTNITGQQLQPQAQVFAFDVGQLAAIASTNQIAPNTFTCFGPNVGGSSLPCEFSGTFGLSITLPQVTPPNSAPTMVAQTSQILDLQPGTWTVGIAISSNSAPGWQIGGEIICTLPIEPLTTTSLMLGLNFINWTLYPRQSGLYQITVPAVGTVAAVSTNPDGFLNDNQAPWPCEYQSLTGGGSSQGQSPPVPSQGQSGIGPLIRQHR
jgi:hypothetical protein